MKSEFLKKLPTIGDKHPSVVSSRNKPTHLFVLFFLVLFSAGTTLHAQTESEHEIIDKIDSLKKVCWPIKNTALTEATTNLMETDTVIPPSIKAGGLATFRSLLNAVEVPNAFPNPDTAEIFDLLGNPLVINGDTIKFFPSTAAASLAQSNLSVTPGFHWVGYQSTPFRPDNVAVYLYNIFHRWYLGLPCNYEDYGGRQWNSDNSGFTNFSDTVFQPNPVFAYIEQPVSCFGFNNGVIKVNNPPQNYYTFKLNGGPSTLNNTFASLTAGIYTITITDSFFNSCDTVITLNQPPSIGGSQQITHCGAYQWPVSGTTYNASGVYTFTTSSAASLCPIVDTLYLTINSTTTSSSNITAYNSYTWPVNGVTYTSPGNYTFNSMSTTGCQTFYILNLNIINSPYDLDLSEDQPISCHGAADGSILATANPPGPNYVFVLDGGAQTSITGFFQNIAPGVHTVCVSAGTMGSPVCKTITLIEPDSLQVQIITDSIVSCLGNDGALRAIITGGTAVLQPYVTSWTNSANVLINPFPNNFDTHLDGLPAGMYTLTVEDDNGCFTTKNHFLNAAAPLNANAASPPILCNGGTTSITPTSTGGIPPISFSIYGLTPTFNYPAGTYPLIATDAKGCADTAIINLNQPPPLFTSMSATACNSYYWSMNASTYTASGTYVAVLTTLQGCTVLNMLNLTIHTNTTSSVSVTACSSYQWPLNSATYTASGNYTGTTLNANGCLETVALSLTINQPTTSTTNATACNFYNWSVPGANNPYTVSGTYTKTFLNSNGCVHTANLNLTILQGTTSNMNATACDSYTWPLTGLTYTASGTYTKTSSATNGCTNTANLNLTIFNSTTSTTNATACATYNWTVPGANNPYIVSGTYTKTFLNPNGCVHTATLNLLIHPNPHSSITVSACNAYNWLVPGASNPYTSSGMYTLTSMTSSGCVRKDTLNLTINLSTSSSQAASACGSYTWTIGTNSVTYTASGIYTQTSQNASGCLHRDSLYLLIKQASFAVFNVNANNGYVWPVNGNTYTASGSYSVTTTNAAGCDSIITLNLNINQIPSSLTVRCFIEGYMESGNSMRPVLFNQGQPSLASECDSVQVELHATAPPYQVLHSQRVVLLRNGNANCTFPPLFDNYYIAVKHRNAVETWSSLPVSIGAATVNYNFTTAANKAFGENQQQISPTSWAFFSGDIDHNENIDLLDLGLIETDINDFNFGYINTDINGDGTVDLLDLPLVETNITNYIFSMHP